MTVGARTRRWPAQLVKRAMDLALATVGLVVLSPVMLVTAVALLVTQGRPILFRQRRPGLHGVPFTIIKFRTMRPPLPGEVAHLTDRQRMTRLGRLLRITSLDETPEFWNVVRGEMSLVGPRPLLMEYLAAYTPRQARRHDVRPGMTSWAVVNGRHARTFDERVELDIWYVENWSLRLDVRILLTTVVQVLRRSDVTPAQDVADVGFPLPGAGRPSEGERSGEAEH